MMLRCIHCRGDVESPHKFYGVESVVYPRASMETGRTVIAHLRCVSVPSFETTDEFLAILLPLRSHAA